MTRFGLLLIATLAVGGCVTASAPPAPLPPAGETALRVTINATPDYVRQAIIARAAARGTAGSSPDARTIVLERQMAETSPALQAVCGPHKPGRRVRVLIKTDGAGNRTVVTERRFLVDGDGTRCAVVMTSEDVAAGNRALAELKAQAESQMAGR